MRLHVLQTAPLISAVAICIGICGCEGSSSAMRSEELAVQVKEQSTPTRPSNAVPNGLSSKAATIQWDARNHPVIPLNGGTSNETRWNTYTAEVGGKQLEVRIKDERHLTHTTALYDGKKLIGWFQYNDDTNFAIVDCVPQLAGSEIVVWPTIVTSMYTYIYRIEIWGMINSSLYLLAQYASKEYNAEVTESSKPKTRPAEEALEKFKKDLPKLTAKLSDPEELTLITLSLEGVQPPPKRQWALGADGDLPYDEEHHPARLPQSSEGLEGQAPWILRNDFVTVHDDWALVGVDGPWTGSAWYRRGPQGWICAEEAGYSPDTDSEMARPQGMPPATFKKFESE